MTSTHTIHPQRTDLAFTRDSPYGTVAEPTYSGALSFMRRPYSRDLTGIDVAVVGVPFDLATTHRPGSRFGPRAVREASTMLAWAKPDAWDFDPFDRLAVIDYGDVWFDSGRPADVPETIMAAFQPLVEAGVMPLTLGGDHFVSFPVLHALAAKHGPLALVHFDAHSDTWSDDDGRIDHGTMFFHAARLGLVDPNCSIQLGMRTHNPETHGYQVLSARWMHANGIQACIDAIHERVGARPCYVSFDIDFLEPAFAPGTGTPVVGGFTTAEAQRLLRGLAGLDMRGIDVVEVAPVYDHAGITALAAASMAQELLCAVASRFANRGLAGCGLAG
ncbi:MAG: agmatinase [Pseudomarimonas sp.]